MSLAGLADLATDVAAGVLGLVDAVTIGDITVSALKGLSAPDTSFVTRKPVQAGYTMTDAQTHDPKTMTLTVLLADPEISAEAGLNAVMSGDLAGLTDTWRSKRDTIQLYKQDSEIINVQTHDEGLTDCLIIDIDPIYDVDQNDDAWIATITVQQIIQVGSVEADGLLDSALSDVGL